MSTHRRLWLSTSFLLSLNMSAAFAQTAALKGKVTDAQSGEALPQANVQVIAAGVQTGAVSNLNGEFEVRNLAAGTYTVIASFVGYDKKTLAGVALKAGEIKTLNIALSGEGVTFNPIVVSGSRRQEKALEAPVSISVLEASQIRGRAVSTPTDYLRGLPAVDIATNGIAQSNVTVRGFNNIFSGALLSLTDNRYAAVPSLRLNAYNFIPLTGEDIARIEVVLGPGAALYGPNSANGVMHIITKSPFESAGTTVSGGGGGRDFFNFGRNDTYEAKDLNHPNGRLGGRNIYMGAFRHASVLSEKVAFKISGQYYRGRDWQDYFSFSALPARIPRFRTTATGLDTVVAPAPNNPNFDVEKIAGEARLDIRPNANASLIFNAGYNQGDQIELTGLGPAQADDWSYRYLQARFNYKNLFLQSFVNASNAGDTYILNTGQLIEDRSKVIVGQVQHSATLGQRQRFTYGFDGILTRPDTKGSINGRNEDIDNINEYGIYLQSESKLSSKFDLIGAARLDYHNRINNSTLSIDHTVFSPRAALVFKPVTNHTLRATYNRAFGTPSTNSLFLDILLSRQAVFDVRTRGVPGETGYHFSYNNGRPQMVVIPQFGQKLNIAPGIYTNTNYVDNFWPVLNGLLGEAVKDPKQIRALFPIPSNVNVPDAILLQFADVLYRILPATLPANSVAGALRRLNLIRAQQPGVTDPFDTVDPSTVQDIEPIKPTIHNNFEFGYKGVIGNKLLVTVDIYHTRIKDFVGPLKVETPTVHMNDTEFQSTLSAQLNANPTAVATLAQLNQILKQLNVPLELTPESYAALLAGYLKRVPLGIVSPTELSSGTEITQTFRNFGQVSLNGMDVSLSFYVTPNLAVSGNYSFVTLRGLNIFKRPNRIFLNNLDGITNLALNAPGNKAALAVQYRAPERGYDFELRGRYIDGFPMESGAYAGEIQTYTVFDLNFGYDLPFAKNTRFALNVNNLFDKKHLEFIGAPILGRLIMTRLTQSF